MCNRCSPRSTRSVEVTPDIEAAARLIRSLNGCYSGPAHVVLEDLNLDDGHIRRVVADVATEVEERRALQALLPMSRLQRLKAIHLAEFS